MFSEPCNETVLVGNLCPISDPHTAEGAVMGTKYDAINLPRTCTKDFIHPINRYTDG